LLCFSLLKPLSGFRQDKKHAYVFFYSNFSFFFDCNLSFGLSSFLVDLDMINKRQSLSKESNEARYLHYAQDQNFSSTNTAFNSTTFRPHTGLQVYLCNPGYLLLGKRGLVGSCFKGKKSWQDPMSSNKLDVVVHVCNPS
jgi:hypothetical protein